MPTFTDPTADPFTTSDVVTGARLKTYTQDNPLALYQAPTCRVYNSAGLTIATSTRTAITANSERHDNAALHSTASNTSRLTVPTGWAGVYSIFGCVEWDGNATGVRQLELRLNGATLIAVQQEGAPPASAFQQTISAQYKLAVADYIEMTVYQTSGGNRTAQSGANYSPEFGMSWLSAG